MLTILASKVAPYGKLKNMPKVSIVGGWILDFLSKNAYWICLFAGLGGLLSYMAGFKKGGKVSVFCIIIYWVVAAICSTN